MRTMCARSLVSAVLVVLVVLVVALGAKGSTDVADVAAETQKALNLAVNDRIVLQRWKKAVDVAVLGEPLLFRKPTNVLTSFRLLASNTIVQAGTASGSCSITLANGRTFTNVSSVQVTVNPFSKTHLSVFNADYIATRTELSLGRLFLMFAGAFLVVNAARLSRRLTVYYTLTSMAIFFTALIFVFLFLRKTFGNRLAYVFGALGSVVTFIALRLGLSVDSVLWGAVWETVFNTITLQEGYETAFMVAVCAALLSVVVAAYLGPPSESAMNGLRVFLMGTGAIAFALGTSDYSLGILLAIIGSIVAILVENGAGNPHDAAANAAHAAAYPLHMAAHSPMPSAPTSPLPGAPPHHVNGNGNGNGHHAPRLYHRFAGHHDSQYATPVHQQHQHQQHQQHQEYARDASASFLSPSNQRYHELKCEHLRRDIADSPSRVLRRLERRLPANMREAFASFYADNRVLTPQAYEVVAATYEDVAED
ncbi:hypothetical protein PTSG_01246 [Salpingoeca rosetta]|uniref:Uncharacterized protein n=1 Tax=Salpingoeca rosetta (strain ATCC 50818 / BSB-021) TaxID=946362 RepID=F2U182_SALR5|nr:uncharacterized protein PTSG_01246 [Salpingoeca rosetta]EGD80656.1 hypothetical protein PTSG_01246 [Salpingoeca rosetta]|eukprot:XP_004997217.1 hypothetical protein PTSG_01246 [Salpingoeca rosetta]